ncbi:MAG: Uma2 family endonuclease [Desulfamplus sp.]|nr:Uma2 family endonuclease [Desulfamplus sp.]
MLAHKTLLEKFSYADYLAWSEDERFEIIEGVIYDMSPAPSIKHQDISFRLAGIFYQCLKKSRCRAFTAPFDVMLIEEKKRLHLLENKTAEDKDILEYKDIQTVVQPDLVVVCDDKKLKERGCFGSPDIAVEILSKSTAYKDETEKLKIYEKHGVKEYWIINPDAEYIMVYRLDGIKYGKPDYLIKSDILISCVVEGLVVDLAELWS